MPKRLTFDVPDFLEACSIASSEGGGLAEVAALLGVSERVVSSRRYRLAKKGIPLPRLKGSPRVGTYPVKDRDYREARLRPQVQADPWSFQFTVTQRGTHEV